MTHTRTHLTMDYANPYIICVECKQRVTGHHDDRCCDQIKGFLNFPCMHRASIDTVCPSWGPVDSCQCIKHLGYKPHA